jgi:hypothetical protein
VRFFLTNLLDKLVLPIQIKENQQFKQIKEELRTQLSNYSVKTENIDEIYVYANSRLISSEADDLTVPQLVKAFVKKSRFSCFRTHHQNALWEIC